jgi:hypothetical protein
VPAKHILRVKPRRRLTSQVGLYIIAAVLISLGIESRFLVHADVSAPSETGDTVHANPFNTTSQGTSPSGNQVYLQVYALAFNPLDDGDPQHDYFLFDIQVTTTPANGGWSIDTDGENDPNGPTIKVNAGVQSCVSQAFDSTRMDPSTNDVYSSSNSPISLELTLPLPGGASASIGDTFTTASSQTSAVKVSQCSVQWNSGYCDNLNGIGCLPAGSYENAYSYHFVTAIQVPENESPTLNITAEASFWNCNTLCITQTHEHATSQLIQTYSMPPTTIVTSNPAGPGYVSVDGASIITPQKFVWNIGDSHLLTATQFVPGNTGVRYNFVSWSDGGATSHDIQAPSSAENYTADYQEQNRLIIAPITNGSTDPPPSTYWYSTGQSVVVKALPAPGYQLDNWVLDGANAGNNPSIQFTMDVPHNLTAVFESEPVLDVSVGNGGSVIVVSPNINNGIPVAVSSGSRESFSVETGTNVTLTAAPTNSFAFGNWTGTYFQTINPYTFAVTANIQEQANFHSLAASTSIANGLAPNRASTPVNSAGSGPSSSSHTDTDTILLVLAIIVLLVAVALIARRPSRPTKVVP